MKLALAVLLACLGLGVVLSVIGRGPGSAPSGQRGKESATTPAVPALAEGEAALAERRELATPGEEKPRADSSLDRPIGAAAERSEQVVVSARLIDEQGEPLPGARLAWVESTETELHRERQSVAADRAGGVWLAVERSGGERGLTLSASAPGRVRLFLPISGGQLRESQLNLGEQILPPGGAVGGRVLDASGVPFAGARVSVTIEVEPRTEAERRRLRVWDWPSRISKLPVWPVAVSDPDGRYHIDGVPLGRFALLAQVVPGPASELRLPARSGALEIFPGVSLQAPDLVLEHPSFAETVTGVVLDAHGVPVAGVSVIVHGVPELMARSGPDGRFRLLVPEGEAALMYADSGEVWASARDVRGGATEVTLLLDELLPPAETMCPGY